MFLQLYETDGGQQGIDFPDLKIVDIQQLFSGPEVATMEEVARDVLAVIKILGSFSIEAEVAEKWIVAESKLNSEV